MIAFLSWSGRIGRCRAHGKDCYIAQLYNCGDGIRRPLFFIDRTDGDAAARHTRLRKRAPITAAVVAAAALGTAYLTTRTPEQFTSQVRGLTQAQ
ncbi:hypothetical protein [Streptomyces violascens]|uniref:Uncharacterized protein n=1 Tax=Streptomyces violascens TaxID=67381 RepID=A0ABQ3QS82_9ACTN|nr:hypothetical protein [Streptomyces violascens]GGU48127.1 hypothetical protein GCM10010289_80870 [Streptomyces violascens]GHI40132.1 hypothetical protein Sviol_45400 [Streptomyces violascens]